MRKYTTNSKKKGRKQTHSKTQGHYQNNDDSNKTVPESSIKNARIKSAIENGFRFTLPSDTKGLNLSKFEHKGKEGPLVVYAQDKKTFNQFGHFSVITSFKPTDSLRNQLFFASKPVYRSSEYAESTEALGKRGTEDRRKQSKKDVTREATTTLVNSRSQKNNGDKVRQTRRQPNSFEELVKRYKDRQEKYMHLLGDDSLYLFQKIDRMCKAGKREKDTNFPREETVSRDSKKTHSGLATEQKEKVVFPKIKLHEPSGKKVHIKLPQPTNQVGYSKR